MRLRKIPVSTQIPKMAIAYWQQTMPLQLAFSLIYFTIYLGLTFLLYNKLGLLTQMQGLRAAAEQGASFTEMLEQYQALFATEAFRKATLYSVGILSLVWPLNLGLLRVYQKMDLKEEVRFSDLFAGYEGHRFFGYLGFALFWFSAYYLSKGLIILAPIWVLITLVAGPLIFLEKRSLLQALQGSYAAFKLNFKTYLATMIFAFVGSYMGLLLCGFGVLFTFPLWNAAVYALYKESFEKDE